MDGWTAGKVDGQVNGSCGDGCRVGWPGGSLESWLEGCRGRSCPRLLRRWFTESARWLVMVGKSHQALKELQKVARINGKKEEGDKLDIEVKGSGRVPWGISGVFYRGWGEVTPLSWPPTVGLPYIRPSSPFNNHPSL